MSNIFCSTYFSMFIFMKSFVEIGFLIAILVLKLVKLKYFHTYIIIIINY